MVGQGPGVMGASYLLELFVAYYEYLFKENGLSVYRFEGKLFVEDEMSYKTCLSKFA